MWLRPFQGSNATGGSSRTLIDISHLKIGLAPRDAIRLPVNMARYPLSGSAESARRLAACAGRHNSVSRLRARDV
jgi:hypothetical protein